MNGAIIVEGSLRLTVRHEKSEESSARLTADLFLRVVFGTMPRGWIYTTGRERTYRSFNANERMLRLDEEDDIGAGCIRSADDAEKSAAAAYRKRPRSPFLDPEAR